jgi:hypothetical protein
MKAITTQRMARILTLTSLFAIFFLIVDGCKDDSGPTGPIDLAMPSVAGHWLGSAHESWPTFPGGAISHTYAVDANINQSSNILGGNWLWTMETNYRTRCYFKGTITTSRNLTIAETSFVAENWNGKGWGVSNFSASLSALGDTISSSWTGTSTTWGPSTGGFLLVKQK